MVRNDRRTWISSIAMLLVVATVGCATRQDGKWKLAKPDVRKTLGMKPKEGSPQVPKQLIASWVDTTMTTPGHKPLRGFGGRIVFFGEEGTSKGVKVNGELVVYAFDETDRPKHETQPTRRYIFPAEQFVKHEGPSSFGPSYSVWLPWDEIGGDQRKISLIVRFEPQGGPMIVGEQTDHLLPGIVRPERAMADSSPVSEPPVANTATGVTQASYQSGQPPEGVVQPALAEIGGAANPVSSAPPTRPRAATISLSPQLTERIAAAKAARTRREAAAAGSVVARGDLAPPATAGSAAPASTPTDPAPISPTPGRRSSDPANPSSPGADDHQAPVWGWPSEWSGPKR